MIGLWMMFVGGAEARIPGGAHYVGIDGQCLSWQNQMDALLAEYYYATPERQAEILKEGRGIYEGWQQYCSARWGNIWLVGASCAEELYGLPCPTNVGGDLSTYDDTDADGMFDFDEVVFGLDALCADTDGDRLLDGIDPSWLGDFVDALPDAQLGVTGVPGTVRTEIARSLVDVEAASVVGDRSSALDALTEVEVSLGGCVPNPRTGAVSAACVGSRILSDNLAVPTR
ncbi:MAG: hypothetical protein ABMB14_10510 [Myxococcota bacterium]